MKHLQRVLPKAADCLNSSRRVEFKAQLLIRTLGFRSCDVLGGEKEHRFQLQPQLLVGPILITTDF